MGIVGIVGIATVIDVAPCPSLELGEGRVVLTTITRTAGHIYTLTLDNDAVIEVTSSHRLFSADRNDWVPVGQLALGETLKSYNGEQQVKSLELQPNAQQVYNIEVEAEHRYFVAEAQVLSHNDCPKLKKSNVSTGEGRDHITYAGIKDGKPYSGYASAESSKGLTPEKILEERYKGDFSDFGGRRPKVTAHGEGVEGKALTRGTEQAQHQDNVTKYGKDGVANKQNPVGPNNRKKDAYMKKAGVPYQQM